MWAALLKEIKKKVATFTGDLEIMEENDRSFQEYVRKEVKKYISIGVRTLLESIFTCVLLFGCELDWEVSGKIPMNKMGRASNKDNFET